MPVDREKIDERLEDLKRKRDELRVQIHLAKAEARDEWDKAEDKWKRFESQAKRLRDRADEQVGKVREAVKILAEELEDAYGRIRVLVKERTAEKD